MDPLVKKLLEKTSAERIGRGVLEEMKKTSNPELALQIAKETLAREVDAYVGSEEVPRSRAALLVEKWAKISEQVEEPMDDEAVTAVVMELAASNEFPSHEDWNRHAFMLDAPNELNEVVEPGAVPGDEPRPYGEWDLEDEDSLGPPRPRTKTHPSY